MANTYQFNVLTIDGAALIAQATAANPIVYVGALSRATAAASAAELATAPASWYTGKTGEIVAVSATGNVAEIRAVWRNAGQSQLAKSVAITARLASQSDAQAVVITAMSDPDSTIVLPGSTDTGAGVAIPFYVQIGAAGSVEVTPGACASIADLARFVSIHAAGNPNTGDAQTVRGAKTFVDPVTLSATIAPNASGVNLGAADARFSQAYVSGTAYIGGIVAEYPYEPSLGNYSASYGSGGAYWTNDMGLGRFDIDPEFTAGGSTLRVLYNTDAGGAVATSTTVVEIGPLNVTFPAANLLVGGMVSTSELFECRYTYGDESQYYQGLYGMGRIQYYDSRYQDTVDIRAECGVAPRWWVTFGDVDPVLQVTPDGVSISGGFTPPTPEYDSGTGTSIPVGGIILAAIAAADSAGGGNFHCGDTVVYDTAATNPPWLMCFARGNTGSVLGVGAGMPFGTYKFLCDCGVAYNTYSFALVIRVA